MKQARIIERELRRRIWKYKVIIDFLIDDIICDYFDWENYLAEHLIQANNILFYEKFFTLLIMQ